MVAPESCCRVTMDIYIYSTGQYMLVLSTMLKTPITNKHATGQIQVKESSRLLQQTEFKINLNSFFPLVYSICIDMLYTCQIREVYEILETIY